MEVIFLLGTVQAAFLSILVFNKKNRYRVEETKSRLADPQYASYTLLAIAFDRGFNSKSSFNSIFKKYTGSTPSYYMKNLAM